MASINGFTVSSSASRIGIKSYTVPGTKVVLPVRSEIAPLLIGLSREFHQTVEPLVRGWCWGYAYRPVTGGGSYSFHAAGIAVDLNAPRHAYGRRNTFNAADQVRCRALAKKYGCRWGGDYRGTRDDMHFEVIVPRAQALALVKRLQTPVKPPAPTHVHQFSPAMPLLRRGMNDASLKGEPVKDLQQHLRYWRKQRGLQLYTADGDFGAMTQHMVEAFQQAYAQDKDGMVGEKTWALLHSQTGGKYA